MENNNSHGDLQPDMYERAQARKARIAAHRSHSFQEADNWDLDYWQSVGPEERLSALVALRNDLKKVEQARGTRHGYGS